MYTRTIQYLNQFDEPQLHFLLNKHLNKEDLNMDVLYSNPVKILKAVPVISGAAFLFNGGCKIQDKDGYF